MAIETRDDVAAMIHSSDFGWAATYTPSGGSAVPTTVLVDPGIETEDGAEATAAVGDHTITMLVADVPAPERNAVIVATNPDTDVDETYLVNAVLENDGKIVTVAATRR